MPEYEVIVVCEVSATYIIEAESQTEAANEAQTIWSGHDLDCGDATLVHVLIERPVGSRHFVEPSGFLP